jgi:hypothetical protein
MSTEQPPNVAKVEKSASWRIIYTNAVTIGFGENESRLVVGFDNDLTKPGTNITEEVVIVMHHRTAKMVAFTLNAIIANWESKNGPIPLNADKVQEIEKQLGPLAEQPQA